MSMKLGDKVRDEITGFEGSVTGIVDYITGCRQMLVQPRVKDDAAGEYPKAAWVDEDRLVVIEKRAKKFQVLRAGAGEPAPAK